ncbi:hypothetical protein COT29_01060 [Candidatus Micrarchaeota archaeon CG08_land_8_20_14_0_20_59_11]|nr:MAG: hypothetical protein COT29_01060 [Candidatus Micrarchaeota archaeon CG08_land_8_20_14_0_20_59_11]PIT85738.1 MAG: hypothetical protein COU36_01550 [Candidatus Micrarchaeota archaeon CG10_big_fil_rev_8_21_14_0_10_59_7]
MGFLDAFMLKRKAVQHSLKWPLPEARLTAPVADAEDAVAKIKKAHAKFLSGGEFVDTVYAKQYGEGVFAYMLIRTDKKTENETLLAETYMLNEDERLGVDVESSFSLGESLERMGYARAFPREVTEWRFGYMMLRVAAFDITDFGAFVEVALPSTKVDKVRELQEKTALKFLEQLGVKKEEAIPADVVTLQFAAMMDDEPPGGASQQSQRGRWKDAYA